MLLLLIEKGHMLRSHPFVTRPLAGAIPGKLIFQKGANVCGSNSFVLDQLRKRIDVSAEVYDHVGPFARCKDI